jgi:hypothetical protein
VSQDDQPTQDAERTVADAHAAAQAQAATDTHAAADAAARAQPAAHALPPGGQPAITERPEVLAGAAFAGAFVAARILKRIFD